MVKVKHAGKTFEVNVPADALGEALKQQLVELTGVSLERQKVLFKGKQVKNDTILSSLKLTPASTILMLGTPEEANASAKTEPRTQAELEAELQSAAGSEMEPEPQPAGLTNLGNTCYANSTLQALRKAPELNMAVQNYTGDNQLVRALAQLWSQLDPPTAAKTPYAFIQTLRQAYPQFGEIGQHGVPKQQDAEEMWTQLMTTLKQAGIEEAGGFFDGTLEVTTKPVDFSGSPQTVSEDFSKLNCHITAHTNFLKDGLRAGLSEEIEKHSSELDRDARFHVTRRISRLPKYLTVQFVRFFWRRDTNKSSKILRKVAFPMQLDLADLATTELQAKLAPARTAFRDWENAEEEARRAERRAKFATGDAEADIAKAKSEAEALHKKFIDNVHGDLANDIGANPTGVYDLQAIVTHQGVSSDSGHYQAFVRNEKRQNSWWRFNDDKVTEVEDSRIEQLAGGGESDSALILLYRSTN